MCVVMSELGCSFCSEKEKLTHHSIVLIVYVRCRWPWSGVTFCSVKRVMKDPGLRSSISGSNMAIITELILSGQSSSDQDPFAEYLWMENEEEFNRQVRSEYHTVGDAVVNRDEEEKVSVKQTKRDKVRHDNITGSKHGYAHRIKH